jgi:hypothetical protein
LILEMRRQLQNFAREQRGATRCRSWRLRWSAYDVDLDGLPGSTALGDDSNGSDDEDGVRLQRRFSRAKWRALK